MHPPHNDSSVALYAWDHEEPMFIGDFGCIIEHWGDYVNISLSLSLLAPMYKVILPSTFITIEHQYG